MPLSQTISDIITKEFLIVDFIDFALLFGSFSIDKATTVSDVDIGIYVCKDISLMEIGLLTSRLQKALKRKIDIIVLNDIYKKRPVFAYEVVKNGLLLFCKNPERFIEFKKKTFLYYLDSKYLIDEMDRSFKERLKSGRFGERNYVGEI